jgi:LmbE family N-acetylglucosaminyl deacetylase
MPRIRHLAFALCLAVPAAAQHIKDPANLMGERVSPPALADTLPIDHGAPALEQLLRKLRTRASMMLIVAHPDDEDSGLLTYESRGMGARVAMLTLNRGEGGQNLMSADFNDALGLIRTQELLAEDRYTGTDQMFGTEVDFGFSKTKQETFEKWGHDRVLYDAVRCVRLYRPLILASVFIGEPTDGHGHHQVAGEITQEVFLAAADPKVFPEMGLPAWAPLKVFARVPFARIDAQGMFDYATGKYMPPRFENYVTGKITSTPPTATVTIHEGDKPAIPAFQGMSYIQWARQGLLLQKSQIGANFRIPPAGVYDSGYTLYGTRLGTKPCAPVAPGVASLTWQQAVKPCPNFAPSAGNEADLFTGIDTSLPGIADLAPDAPKALRAELVYMDAKLAEAQKQFDPNHPEAVAEPLRQVMVMLDAQIDGAEGSTLPAGEKFNLLHELRVKRVQLNDALVLALGITLEAHVDSAVLTTQSSAPVSTSVGNDGTSKVSLSGLVFNSSEGAQAMSQVGFADTLIEPHSVFDHHGAFEFDRKQMPTRPYFSRKDVEQPYYDIDDPALRNAPSTPNPLVVTAFAAGLELQANVRQSDSPQQTSGVQQAAVFVPPMSLAISPTAGIVPLANPQLTFRTVLIPFRAGQALPKIDAPPSWEAKPLFFDPLPPAGSSLTEDWQAKAMHVSSGRSYALRASVIALNRTYSEGYRLVGYPGLTYTNFYTPAVFKAVAVDVTTAPNLRIAYLPGTGDEVPQFLPSLGVTPTILTTKDLTLANLQQYDAIVLGVRAYSAHPELQGAASGVLNAYAKQGGVVVVQYSSAGFHPASAPFPYTIPGDSAHNVVDETAPVTLLQPTSPLLTWPNRITPADFNGWIEERGHGFASDWAPEYTPLLEMHDPEQDPQRGGLLVAKVGRGAYIYCALALYRQLPEGVPGSYRLFANLLSYARNPQR